MLKDIRAQLRKNADPAIAESSKRFFKEEIKTYGFKSADVSKIARAYFPQIDKMKKSEVFELCDDLVKSDYMEEFSIACEFCYRRHRDFEKSDFKIFEKWVAAYVNNWAKCDTFCNHSVNALVEKFPELVSDIKKWSKSKNRWVRRASAVIFILSARRGRFVDDVFEIAEKLLTDPDDMVQKGYGWALKAAGEFAPKRVYDFVTARVATMPRTAYRYAIEKLPADMRKKAMAL
ncbi:MAG: DNA alkylation repair protein [Rickettsiales bacterium]|jgi:3-methyladenine DNA glycosylase AlkD|nr:DNA alkylation repair protein [Rickettsiales bacterium]